MTAVPIDPPRTPPRALVRVFWAIHRAIYRVTRGRFGAWRPKAGTRFGTMRLTTVGRRSGKRRVAMVPRLSGMGDDISALAARRSRETAVVVLEPR